MSFECLICEYPYSDNRKPKSIPCGHTLCEVCIASLIKNNSLECPICRTAFQNINVANLPIIYQLMNKNEIKPKPVIQNKGIEKINPIVKANEVCDQIQYLNYVKVQISEKYEEMNTNINQIKE